MTKQEKAVVKRQIPRAALIAAVIVLALAGTALAASFPGLQDWFSRQWTDQTGKTIEKDQMDVITKLTDEVGVSAEAGGVTVTVDSVTRGESILWILMNVDGLLPESELEARTGQTQPPPEGLPEGITPPGRRDYGFLDLELAFDPEIKDEFPAWAIPQNGRREDGSLSILMCYRVPADAEHTPLDAEQITLRLGRLQWGGFGWNVPVAEGPWELTFSLAAMEPEKPLTTGKCRMICSVAPEGAWSLDKDGPLPTENVVFQDIQVTPTEIRFLWADPEQAERIMLPGIVRLTMKDGTEVKEHLIGRPGKRFDGQTVTQSSWTVPMDLSQVVSLTIGDKEPLELK